MGVSTEVGSGGDQGGEAVGQVVTAHQSAGAPEVVGRGDEPVVLDGDQLPIERRGRGVAWRANQGRTYAQL